ncbi:hypothetical protein [Haloglomus litoreum]|uniref:DUF7845 domain-containing protein n=1 Tax=Haloglomus litoreum TaxID=3034026 RepID=UPI0023E7FC6D|nr:hypothetical protein [Haloglomus sp. DT116]
MARERREPVGDDEIEEAIDADLDPVAQAEAVFGDAEPDTSDAERDDEDSDAISGCRWCRELFSTVTGQRTHTCEDRSDAEGRWEGDEPGATEPTAIHDTVKPQVHELNAQLLFTPTTDEPGEDGLYPYRLLLDRWEPDLVCSFEAADTEWVFASEASLEAHGIQPEAYDHKNAGYWQGNIKTRPQDSGESYIEFTAPLVDASDPNLNRRVTLIIRPALEGINIDDDEPIDSLRGCPEGVRIEVKSSSVDREDLLDVIQGFAGQLGIRPDWFARDHVHERSRITGLAYYVRVLKQVADQHLVNPEGLLERLAVFSSRRQGQGELKWDNEDVSGKRTAVSLNPTGLSNLYSGHGVGKLLKCYLMKNAREDARDPDGHPTDHPKLEVQWSRGYTPYDVSIPFLTEHADGGLTIDDLAVELQEYLVNAIQWAGLSRRPEAEHWVPDDHFAPVAMEQEVRQAVDIVGDPIDLAVDQERNLATKAMLEDPPTEHQQGVLRALADGGEFEDQAALADAADTSTSTVSRTFRKYESLLSTMQQLSFADSIVRDRVQELMAILERDLDGIQRGIRSLLSSADQEVPEDSPFGKWVQRYGATLQDHHRDGLRLDLASGNLSRHELVKVLRAGFEAADATPGIDVRKFAFAHVAYHDEQGERVWKNEKVAVNNAVETEILGRKGTGRLV